MKTLFINRHAKSSWDDGSLKDHDRPLNKRGKENARFMAEKFAGQEHVDLIISSTAKRALDTAKEFAGALKLPDDRQKKSLDLYGADIEEILALVNQIPDQYSSVMLFGHNPTFSYFATYLDESFNRELVTCARVKLEFPFESWSMIRRSTGKVVDHDWPKKHPEMEHL